MKIAAAFLSLALLTTSLTPNASAGYVFPISLARGTSIFWMKGIDVNIAAGLSQDFQTALNAGFTDIRIDAVANADSTPNSKGEKIDVDYGGGYIALPIVMKATGILSINSVTPLPPENLFDEISMISVDLETSTLEITSAGVAITDPYVRVICNPADPSTGPMDLTVTLTQPVPEPGTFSILAILGLCLGGCVWRKRRQVV